MVKTASYKSSAFIMALVSTTTISRKCFVISQVPKKLFSMAMGVILGNADEVSQLITFSPENKSNDDRIRPIGAYGIGFR